ncbi:MAG: hypothetical protein ACXVGH_05985 [Mycobacteriales bacterium]
METSRCTNCRNPIKAHHRSIEQPRTGGVFHDDCWDSALAVLQQDYLRRIGEDGVEGLLSPYVVRLEDPFVPEQRVDDQVEDVEVRDIVVPEQPAAPYAVLGTEVA